MSKKMRRRDEVNSVSSSNSRNSERKKSGTRFSLRRFFYQTGSIRSRSRASLDSDSGRSENSYGAGAQLAQLDNGQHSIVSQQQPLPKPIPPNAVTRECPLCLTERAIEDFPSIMTCHHRSCLVCLQLYLRIEITESRVNISCPECAEKLHPNDIREVLQDVALVNKYEDFMVRRLLVSDPDARWCPAPDCGYAVIASGCASCPKLKCERPGCDTSFCYHCKQYWHPNKTCDAARAERMSTMRSSSVSYSHDNISHKDDIKPCPKCGAFIMKMNDGSCNHMACPVCGAEFCWLCMKEISDLHYLSPSGCTFWGKKPWSRKKTILWQLGTLVGAPVGITLIAGIAVPAMIIGLPVLVGRKIHSKYKHSSRYRRNLAITGGVTASVVVSPIIAGLAVGIGVPILLAYTYGVVSISLCRSGGCGVTTTNKGGVRFEFDENEAAGTTNVYAGDNQSVGTGHNVANPSIAPSIGDASLGMTGSLSASGSHMERVGIIRDDCDSVSNRAMVGSSLNGSVCGGSYVMACYQHKLEVQADVAAGSANQTSNKRSSFSSESANISIGEKSATISYGDDASTKALAGSIAGYRDKDNIYTNTGHYDNTADSVSRGTHTSLESVNYAAAVGEPHPRQPSGQSSPISGCSYHCFVDDQHKPSKCRKCRRINSSNGERATDQCSVHFADQVSLQNFQTDDILSPSCSEEIGISMSRLHDKEKSVHMYMSHDNVLDSSGYKKLMTSSVNPGTMPEVENDHPLTGAQSCNSDRKTKSTPMLAKNLCETDEDDEDSLSKSQSVEDSLFSKNKKSTTVPGSTRLRRLSCELATEQGRISPSEIDCTNA